MRVAQVIGKLAAAGVEAVVNNYYCSMIRNGFSLIISSTRTPSWRRRRR